MIKTRNRAVALLLAIVLLAGILPLTQLTAFAAAPKNEAPTRTSVLVGAEGLTDGDTVILGHARRITSESSSATSTLYPLEWQVLDASADSAGRAGGKLLLSKYLLPAATENAAGGIDTAASYGAIALGDGGSAEIVMPDTAAVLTVSKTDTDYAANLHGNYLSAYGEYNIPAAGLLIAGDDTALRERTLRNAQFFELSAQELESYIRNSDDSRKEIIRRPYAAIYAVEDAGDRSWSLRSRSVQEKPCVVSPVVNDPEYTPELGGLIREADPEKTYLSRPAFNLRSSAVSFLYKAETDTKIIGDKADTTETIRGFGEKAEVIPVSTLSGNTTWRAALETLPMTSATTVYHQDGSLELNFDDKAYGYKIGVLTADAAGNVLGWGTARSETFGNVSFKPEKGISTLYFFSYKYDSITGQLNTSTPIKVSVDHPSAMTLGASHIRDGERVWLEGSRAYIANAETGSIGIENTGSTGSMTKTGDINDEYPVRPNEAIFLVGKLDSEWAAPYSCAANLIRDDLTILANLSYDLSQEELNSEIDRFESTVAESSNAACGDAKVYNQAFYGDADDSFSCFLGENYNVMLDALAFTWASDTAYDVDVYRDFDSYLTESAAANKVDHALTGQKLFPLSAGEFMALPEAVRNLLGNIILRSSVTETYGKMFKDGWKSFDFTTDLAYTAEGKVGTITSFTADDSPTAYVAPGFNLRKDHVVYMVQSDAQNKELCDCNSLHEVSAYNGSSTTWNVAILDENIRLSGGDQMTYPTGDPSFYLTGLKPSGGYNDSYVALMLTDSAGNVKKYGRVRKLLGNETSIDAGLSFDIKNMALGDRVYAINEYEVDTADHPIVYASAPLLLWEKKIDGTLTVDPASYVLGETVTMDDSDIKYASGEHLNYYWYYNTHALYDGEEQSWTATAGGSSVTARASLSGNESQCITTSADLTTVLPVYPGTKNQNDFTGGTLYFGPDGADNYIWTIVGKPTQGISGVKNYSTNTYYDNVTVNDALELMRKEAVPVGAEPAAILTDYMTDTVLRTDTDDPDIDDMYAWCDAASATDQLIFRPSYADYQKLQSYSVCAAPVGSSAAVEYLLRNKDADDWYVTVDALGEIQQRPENGGDYTRDTVNVNRKMIVFYSPASCDLTYASLKDVRQSMTGDWKLTVMDPKSFQGTAVSTLQASGPQVTVSGKTADANQNRYVTAWAVKNGQIVWLDSTPCKGSGDFTVNMEMPDSVSYDKVYAVIRIDNGTYHTDICTVPFSNEPSAVPVEIFVNGVLTNSGCNYELDPEYMLLHNPVKVRVNNIRNGYEFDRVTVVYPDIAEEKVDAFGDYYNGYTGEFTVRSLNPIVRIYLIAQEYEISTYVETVDADGIPISEDGGTIKAPAKAFYGETYDFTVTPNYGYFVSKITCTEISQSYPVKDIDVKTPADKPAAYSNKMGAGNQIIVVTMQAMPTYPLTLQVDPEGAGSLTAKLPRGAALSNLLAGEKLSLKPEANGDWYLTGITYRVGAGEEQELAAGKNGYEFTMPAESVTITAHFDRDIAITSMFYDVSESTPQPCDATVVYTVNGVQTEILHPGDEVTATVTCPTNMAIAETVTEPETVMTQTGKYTFTFTMPDSDLTITYDLKKLALKSAYLHVNQDINVVYTVQIPEGFENARADFEFMGQTYSVENSYVDDQGRTCFEFTHLTPQYMGEPIDVTLTAEMGCYTFSHSNEGYSVRKYCANMLGKSQDDLLITLLSDTLVYGAAAQSYTGHNTDALVTDGLTLNPSTYPGISGYRTVFEGTADPSVRWQSASLALSNNMCMEFRFYAENIEGLSVSITVDGRTQDFTEFTPVGGKVYSVSYRGIYASEYNAAVSASFSRNGTSVGNTLKYCVNTYICSKQDSSDTKLSELVKAIYNYGESARIYYNERIAKK